MAEARDDANKENNAPVLTLIQFSKPPFVTFGTVKLGTSKSAVLQIENPIDDVKVQVFVEKIPSSKGFSVDHNAFTIQPESFSTLTITWTPTEEGGIRELLIFNAGVLKHQAVLLGRAEAPKRKKKSLWDTIKNKREGGKMHTPTTKKTAPPLKMTANKTFQVSRNPQYKREKPCSPLAPLNEGKSVKERSLIKHGSADHPLKLVEQKALNPKQRHQSLSDLERIHDIQKNSPVVLLVPAGKFVNSGNMPASPDTLAEKPENKGLTKMFNKTLSPIGTPERFKKLMPRIQSDSALPAAGDDSVPSLKDALDVIGSDLILITTSPRDTSSSCEFSDSLESKSDKLCCDPDKNAFKAITDSPELPESSQSRLTFFVNKKIDKGVDVTNKMKKASFTSATVTKSKVPVEANSPGGRKIKKSRRRLLEKTLELSDGSSRCDSDPGTPSLPVIDTETGTRLSDGGHQVTEFLSSSPKPRLSASAAPITFPLSSPPCMAPSCFSFSASSPALSVPAPTFTITSPPPVSLLCSMPEDAPTLSAPPPAREDLFPVQLAVKNKKRKSGEHLKADEKVEASGKPEQVKRSRVVAGKGEPPRSVQERRSVSQRQRLTNSVTSSSSSSLRKMSSVAAVQAKQPGSKIISRGASSVRASGSVKISKVVAVAQSKLTFIKATQTALPRHPMPFAAKNMFYDERWIEKQERGFTWWINYVLTPDDFKVNTEVAKVSAVSLAMGSDDRFSVPRAPTKEEMSFSTYTAKQKLNRLRRSACQLFTSEAMVKAIQRLELEVEARRLLVRKDRHLWKDIGERKKVLNWLLSYNPLWLRIGLETIFGELISLESNSDALGLAMFILQRLLWNPDIAAEFRHARVPHLYKDGHEEALSRFTLKKLLLLVCFLDKAKESRLIEHDPCLFCLDAEFKESKELLLAFSRDFLSGEGILPRHLSYLGLPVSHVQTPLDEFNFAVKNLAVDLKCGIRLVRVMELLVQDWSLSAKLRLPAISRLQKVHNVDIALHVLKDKGIELKDEHGTIIDSRDIVDGHREKTLSLLWKILFAFHVEVILNEDQLREEIFFLKRTLKTKRRLASLRADRDVPVSPAETRRPYEHTSTKIPLLMDWVCAVCDFYNLKVENFTVSFSDGRVLCYLIHHYHPGLLPDGSIGVSTTQTVECSPRGQVELNCSGSDSDGSFNATPTGSNDCPSVAFKELLENEKNNFRLVNTAVAFLGGVPAMISPADMSNTIPSEKVVMSYLSFLCARLLDLRNETRAARVVQAAWRKHKLKKNLQLYQERNKAAVKIQAAVRRFLQKRGAERQNRAAVMVQSVWRGYAARRWLRRKKEAQLRAVQHKAATVIQAQWRMFSTLRAYHRLRYYTIVVQAQWRMRRAATAYGEIYQAAAVIQMYYRARALSRRDRERYLLRKSSVVKLQRAYRRWQAQKIQKENCAARVIQAAFQKWYKEKVSERSAAAVRIQSWYRMQLCFHQYRKIKRSSVLIQAHFRGHEQRRRFQMLKLLKLQHHSAAVIQSAFRGHVVRKQLVKLRSAAVMIQRRWRASVKRDTEREMFVRLRRAAVTIQAAYRGQAARELLKKQQKAATVIQAAVRKHSAQTQYLVLRKAAAVIQQRYRSTVRARKTKKDYDDLKRAVIIVQANWRGRADRKTIETWHQCATLIQTCYRRHKAQAKYKSKRAAAVLLQRHYRAFLVGNETRKAYMQKKRACIALQAGFRGMRVRTELREKHQAATIIQSVVRRFLCRKHYALLQSAAVIIQCRYRALLLCRQQQSEFRTVKVATLKIQAMFRGFTVRRNLKKRHNSARVIQAQFRMHRIRMAYLATKCAAIIIQERYRAKMLRDKQMLRYGAMRSAAVVIQAAYRGHRARRRMAELQQAATVIQRKFLTIQARKQFLAIKAAALTCQQRYRAATLARNLRLDYLLKRRSVVCLQAAYRGQVARRQLRIRLMAAITIQSHFRKYQQRTNYKRLLWACSVLQARYRANKKMSAEVQALRAKKNAAVVLQAAFRGMKSRQKLKQKHQAASIIQRAFKAHCEHRKYLTLKSYILKIQHRYRATKAAKKQMQRYQLVRKAAVTLQAAYRGHGVRTEVARWHQAATVIQSAFRKHKEHVKFQAMRLSAIMIQRGYRALLLQRRDREHFLRVKQSVVVLQAAFRAHRVRTEMTKMHRAATVIQSNLRRHKQQTAFRRQRWAACVLQQRFRAQRRKQVEVKRYQEDRKAAIVLQAAYRGMKTRQIIKQSHEAARVIQRAYRAHCEHQKYFKLKASALVIQRKYRATVQAKSERNRFIRVKQAVITLQRCCRAWNARQQVLKTAQGERRLRFVSAIFHHLSAIKIQRALRAYWALESAKRQIHSVIAIQRWLRARQQRRLYLQDRRKVITAQRAVKSWLARRHKAASIIQQAVRNFLFVRCQKRVQRGIVKAQALWRGHCSRQLNDNPKLVKLRHRLRLVSAEAREEDKLCNKTSSALEYLLQYKHLSYILEALKNLETATRLSPECCERLVESGATSVLFTLIRCCNRSIPCMNIITLSIQVLLNLSKYHKTVEAVYSVDSSVEILLDLLQRYREKAGDKVAEKGGSIFTKTCFLLALLLQDKHRAEEVKKIPKALDRLCSIYKLTARKHKLDAERNIIKLKMSASVNGSFLATPRKTRPAPKFAPDWVLTKDNLREIVDPLHAIQMVADTLAIVL
ncbi:abnormal spindle-like microcephaly-associated protein [Kryptolebias marmoratus]|uniref:abnormal spindle-like microcephaly-associated protein n=1 Tax=Kryptolebias marmoratus TaxID=37003 RepID=UPI0007F91C23|nr:abnormal spindle-like microcephaly-associated protein [Kryptolebias marmoratus]